VGGDCVGGCYAAVWLVSKAIFPVVRNQHFYAATTYAFVRQSTPYKQLPNLRKGGNTKWLQNRLIRYFLATLVVAQLVKKLPVLYLPRMLNAVFITFQHWSQF
jgi:hypothetical protein